MSNIADSSFVWRKRTDIAQRFREQGWIPPEKHAEEVVAQERHEGAIRAMKKIAAETVQPLRRRA